MGLSIEKTDLCNFADDNTPLSSGDILSVTMKSVEHDMKILLRWFNLNLLKTNTGKFQFMILGKSMRPKYCITVGLISVKKQIMWRYKE